MRAAAAAACLLAVAVLVATTLRRAGADDDDEPRGYDLRHPAGVSASPGASGALSLAIVPRPGYRVSGDGPVVVDLAVTPEQGVTLPRTRYRRDDAADPRADAPRFDLAYRADAAGAYRVTVRTRFWLCGIHVCWPVDDTRAIALTVRAPAPPADAGTPGAPTDAAQLIHSDIDGGHR